VLSAPVLQRLGVQFVAASLCVDLVQPADELDEARRQWLGPPPVRGQRLQRLVETGAAMRPAVQMHKTVLLGNGCAGLLCEHNFPDVFSGIVH